ncbi:MAG TPA: prepilin peptidase [Candidatus Staskawiczbacteria bacterium]|nr:prepilin peptidase [Candidatus Staskawiczbacteria bacterium]
MELVLIFGYFFSFILGLCIGSFLNCLIYRLETEKTLKGRSFCPHCKHQLSWKDLMPVFSFAILGGKCRYCKKKISWQYPAVELATAAIFLLIFSHTTEIINLLFLFYIAASLVAIFVYDLKHYLIPDKILIPATIIVIAYRVLDFQLLLNYFWAAIIASGFFLLIYLLSGGRAMGFGDVKLAILMGILLGISNTLLALFFAFVIGAIIGIISILLNKKSLKSEIPFGPFLVFGTFVALFWGPEIIAWYFNIFA